ncbi:PDZ domain-containing protein [Prochlorococcus sp. MIT 0801]|uniref:PDZ domain-containing protein n=1 Tax=Prochlorococcus sp. MIT 0801 TaxID=1501269 RepID=UPI0004F855C2|nr:PDZ domain-containing protein [Prochlorococcus sp. MIT 0801]AIQ97423.1 carboxyl-terminal protease [Prochlorococcus sp. MIT 0801]
MKRFLLLALSTGLLSPISVKAEISNEIHKRCLDARDYSGCVRTNQSSIHKLKKEITGIGVNLFLNTENSEITIQSIINGTPASNADIESGDVILEIDGKSTKGMGIEEAIELIKGPKNKTVKLVLERTNEKGKRKKIKIRLVRDTFEIPNNEYLNQMKLREWFNRELPSDLDPMLQQNGKSLR